MITTIAEHSYDKHILPIHMADIIDLGCRGFAFTDAMRDLGHVVWPVDIDVLRENREYYRCAISDYNGKAGVIRIADPQGTKIGQGSEVDCYTLESFMEWLDIIEVDLIKMDVEGSEYEIILALTQPPARQLSIEFHMHCGQTQKQVDEIVFKLSILGYKAVSHEKTTQHGAGFNYWDSLFILQ